MQASPLPLLHILNPTVQAILQKGLECVAVLGTRFTMQDGFYHWYLADHEIRGLTPPEQDRDAINRIIFDELGKGRILERSRSLLIRICDNLIGQGAQGIILGCTELPLILQPENCDAPLFNTATLHAETALTIALGESADGL